MGRMEGQTPYARALFAPLVFVLVAVRAGIGTAAQVATGRGTGLTWRATPASTA